MSVTALRAGGRPTNPSRTYASSRGRRVALSTAAVLIAGTAFSSVLNAHDFWLVPDPFAVASGGVISVLGQSGTRFPSSESATPPNRIVDARVIGAGSTTTVSDLTTDGKSLRLREKPATAAQYLVAVRLAPRSTKGAVTAFRRYLTAEGANDEDGRLEREGAFQGRDTIAYRVDKYAKTIVQVGSGGARAFATSAGHALEFIPLTDPASAHVGDTIAIRVVAGTTAASHITVHAGAAADSGLRGQGPGSDPDLHLRADAQGVVRVPLSKGGLWNVRAAHVTTAAGGGEWQVVWTTFVFPAGASHEPLRGDTRGAPVNTMAGVFGDSANVVAALARFHAALSAGDSTGALAVLAADVSILESGEYQNRAEYASHHLMGDIEFARAVHSQYTPVQVVVRGDVAWVASGSTTQGEFRGRPVNSVGAELAVLSRGPAGWQIRSIHWSAHARRTP